MEIRSDDLTGPRIAALLALHLREMRGASPPGTVFALDLSALRGPDVSVWSAWDGEALLGCGALRELGPDAAEIKSLRTDRGHLRKGVATALLDLIVAVARARGYTRLSLETGSGPAFDAALSLYRRRGFREGEPFGDYAVSPFNRFLHLDLTGS
ncbi:MAG: GNAT family N-acetyltransferase [Caulobacteraceae bacterium]